jgi:hypothetical protein
MPDLTSRNNAAFDKAAKLFRLKGDRGTFSAHVIIKEFGISQIIDTIQFDWPYGGHGWVIGFHIEEVGKDKLHKCPISFYADRHPSYPKMTWYATDNRLTITGNYRGKDFTAEFTES